MATGKVHMGWACCTTRSLFGTILAMGIAVSAARADVRSVSKAEYFDLMEAATAAYSDEHIERYIAHVEREGVHEHGFPRLTANLGVLVANGRATGRREAFRRMMTISCRDAAKGKMKLEGNEFSVKELVIALLAVEKAGIFDKATTDGWHADIARVDATRCYRCQPKVGENRAYNWCVFGCASEQTRLMAGLGGDAAFVERYVSDQLRWFDANGMYRDPDQPAVYDFVTRLQFMWILHCGYDGPSRTRLEELLDTAERPTLAMLSACGEIPYGGRSNQFLNNDLFYAADCEWYAVRARRRGDARTAARFRGAARAAVDSTRSWLAKRPVRHIKNLYPRGEGTRGSGIGCERYAYFDKYMVTMGSWAMLASIFCEDGQDALPPYDGAPDSFATTPDFHFVFLKAGDYSAQFDYDADAHYDCDGLGRIQRRGAPSAICMSVPCAVKPNYNIEYPNSRPLAIAPVSTARLEFKGCGHDKTCAWADWKAGALDWKCRLGKESLSSVLSGKGEIAMTLPAFAFDGEAETTISCEEKRLVVRYNGWECRYETDGHLVDTGDVCCNRNGRYRVFEARGRDALRVTVSIGGTIRAVSASSAAAIAAEGAKRPPEEVRIEREVEAACREIDEGQARLSDRCSLADYRALVRATNGTNMWTAALQKALDEHEIVTIPASGEKYFFDGTVIVPSRRRIEATGATIRLADGMRTVLLRNASSQDGTLAPIPASAKRDTDIAIVGGRWEDWCTRRAGYGRTGMFNLLPRGKGNYFGVSTMFFFNSVRRLSVTGATFHHTGGFAVQAGDGDAVAFRDITFDRCFADGLHLNGNLTRVLARNVRGQVGDDLVALNAYDWLNSSVNFGPQQHVLCEDLELVRIPGERVYPAIRIQPAKYRYADGSVVDCAISDVIFRRVKGITTFKMYLQTPRYAIGTAPEWGEVGSGGNLFFEDMEIDLDEPIDRIGQYASQEAPRGHFAAFEFGANLSLVHFSNIDVTLHADKWPLTHLVQVGPKSCLFPGKDGKPAVEIFDPYVSCRVERVVLENVRVHGTPPADLVYSAAFDDINKDGRSTGRGVIEKIDQRD